MNPAHPCGTGRELSRYSLSNLPSFLADINTGGFTDHED
jgi:hypothetical protein